jgi:hypothetical protein
MSFDPSAVPTRLLEAARKHTLVPLVGAGVSRQAGAAFPSWNDLLLEMAALAVARGYFTSQDGTELEALVKRGQSLMAAEALRFSFPVDEYETILEERFNPRGIQPAEVHRALFKLQPPVILTTNYDRLLEDAYAEEYRRAAQVLTYRDAVVVQKNLQSGRLPEDRPIVFKIHGTIDQPDGIILSERDYRKLIHNQPGYRIVLSAIFLTQVILMLGFSFADPELRLLLEEHRESLKNRAHPDYIFLARDAIGGLEARRLREDFGVQLIPYDASSGHPELLEFLKFLIENGKGAA